MAEERAAISNRRGQGGYQAGFPGGGMRIPVGGKGGIGIVGLLVLVGLMLFFGIDPRVLLEGGGPPPQQMEQGTDDRTGAGVDDEMKQFVSVVLADTEDVWNDIFAESGREYREPELVLYRGRVSSACGLGMAAMGPFYCPSDQKVYLDFSFFEELKSRFDAPGDFAQAYVIAHEIGHHVQKQLGIADKVAAAQRRAGERESNALQVRMELQADCLAGVFANHADRSKDILQPGDVDEALRAASAIGDDKIQEQTQGYVVPDSFTHGSSEMRARWFKRGLESGSMSSCDTFGADRL